MAHRNPKETLNNGTTANDGTGDSLRDAADKINTNFTTLFDLLGDSAYITDLFHLDSTGDLVFGDEGLNTLRLIGNVASADRTITLPDATGTVVLQDRTETLTNKTLTTPIIGVIHDSNNDAILTLNSQDSANHFQLTSGDSSTGCAIEIIGDSGDVDIHLNPMNGGVVRSGCRIIMGNETVVTGAITPSVPITFLNNNSSQNFTLADGDIIGQTKKFVNINSGLANVIPTTFPAGSAFKVAQNRAIEAIWTSVGWITFGADSDGSSITI